MKCLPCKCEDSSLEPWHPCKDKLVVPPVIPALGRWRQAIPRAGWLARPAEVVDSIFKRKTLSQYIRLRVIEKNTQHHPSCGLHTHVQSQVNTHTMKKIPHEF